MKTNPRIVVITGNGKGKTTGGMGRALAAAIEGQRVLVIQFLKGTGYTGELQSASQTGVLHIRQFGAGCPVAAQIRQGLAECDRCGICFRENRSPANGFAFKAFQFAREAVDSGEWDLVVLDEISHAINRKLLDSATILKWVELAAEKVRLLLTGRNMPPEFVALADEATECVQLKHPFTAGSLGRRGIEY